MIDIFSKFGLTVPLKNKNAQKIKDFSEKILINSKRSLNLIETDREKECLNKIFTELLNKNNNKIFSRNKSYGAVLAERVNRNIRNLLKRPVFERCDANWIDFLPIITKQNITRIHSSTKITTIGGH